MTTLTRRALTALLAMVLASCTLFGCSSQTAGDEPAESGGRSVAPAAEPETETDRTVTDMKGDEVVVPADNNTILTVNSVATQMVVMLGGEECVATLGQGFQYGDESLNKKMFPGLDGVKAFTRDDATVENVAVIDPGLVVIDVEDTVSALRDAGIPAAFVSVNSPDTIMQAVDIIGGAIGGDAIERASAYRAFYESALAEAQAKSAGIAEDEKPTVLYLRSTEKTTGEGSMPDSWITAAGGVNVAARLGLSGSGVDINVETIMNENPSIIICESEQVRDEIMGGAAYAELDAVKNSQVYAAPLGTAVWSMGTAEAALMVSWAGTVINPELYADVDIDATTTGFFKEFYGYDLSEAELDAIFHR